MIGFRRMPLWKRILIRVSPKARKQYEKDLREAIEYLIEHPEASCKIEGQIIPDGFGHGERRERS